MNAGVDNDFYDDLGEKWYAAEDHPIALLRSEARLRDRWVAFNIRENLGWERLKVLDIGCGGGFASNALAREDFAVTGLDLSARSLRVARAHDSTNTVEWIQGNAYSLPFEPDCFDVVCALDFLEHVTDPGAVVAEASRVLRPGGLFCFHTFNRTLKARLLAVHALSYLFPRSPRRIHSWRLFIKPDELKRMCTAAGLQVDTIQGLKPRLRAEHLSDLLFCSRVPTDFSFVLTRDLSVGYMGYAWKRASVSTSDDRKQSEGSIRGLSPINGRAFSDARSPNAIAPTIHHTDFFASPACPRENASDIGRDIEGKPRDSGFLRACGVPQVSRENVTRSAEKHGAKRIAGPCRRTVGIAGSALPLCLNAWIRLGSGRTGTVS